MKSIFTGGLNANLVKLQSGEKQLELQESVSPDLAMVHKTFRDAHLWGRISVWTPNNTSIMQYWLLQEMSGEMYAFCQFIEREKHEYKFGLSDCPVVKPVNLWDVPPTFKKVGSELRSNEIKRLPQLIYWKEGVELRSNSIQEIIRQYSA